MEERGILEEFALPVSIIVQSYLLCRIKDLKCEPGDGPGMRFVNSAGPAQLEHTSFTGGKRPKERKVFHAGEIVHQKAVLQSTAGGCHGLQTESLS